MNEPHLLGPPDDYTMLTFEESGDATLVQFQGEDAIVYRITALFVAPHSKRYADLGAWTLERTASAGMWQALTFNASGNAGKASDFTRRWVNEFRRLRNADEGMVMGSRAQREETS